MDITDMTKRIWVWLNELIISYAEAGFWKDGNEGKEGNFTFENRLSRGQLNPNLKWKFEPLTLRLRRVIPKFRFFLFTIASITYMAIGFSSCRNYRIQGLNFYTNLCKI